MQAIRPTLWTPAAQASVMHQHPAMWAPIQRRAVQVAAAMAEQGAVVDPAQLPVSDLSLLLPRDYPESCRLRGLGIDVKKICCASCGIEFGKSISETGLWDGDNLCKPCLRRWHISGIVCLSCRFCPFLKRTCTLKHLVYSGDHVCPRCCQISCVVLGKITKANHTERPYPATTNIGRALNNPNQSVPSAVERKILKRFVEDANHELDSQSVDGVVQLEASGKLDGRRRPNPKLARGIQLVSAEDPTVTREFPTLTAAVEGIGVSKPKFYRCLRKGVPLNGWYLKYVDNGPIGGRFGREFGDTPAFTDADARMLQ